MTDFVTTPTNEEIVGYIHTDKPEKEFKKLFGQRVYLEFPEMPKSQLFLDKKSTKEIREEYLKTISKLKIYAVGDGVTHLKEGDEVLVDSAIFNPDNPKMRIIELSDNKSVLLISVFDIIHLW